jgi:hypothetical protein
MHAYARLPELKFAGCAGPLGPVVGLIVSLDLRPGLQPPHDIVEMLQRPAVGAVIDSDYVRYDPRKRTFSGSPLILTLCQKKRSSANIIRSPR